MRRTQPRSAPSKTGSTSALLPLLMSRIDDRGMTRFVRFLVARLACTVLVLVIAVPASASSHESFTPKQREAIEKIFKDYLLENPEVILDALRILEQRQKVAEAQKSREQVRARRDEIFNDPSSPVGWNPDGNVTVVEFFDYQCPYCQAVVPRLAQLKREDAGIRYVYKEWPILGPASLVAAKAALAAQEQGLYEEFHEAMMTFPGKFKEPDVFATAEKVGLDIDRLREDMQSPEIEAALARTRELARVLGITGTPAFVIGDKVIPGAVGLPQLKATIKKAREGA